MGTLLNSLLNGPQPPGKLFCSCAPTPPAAPDYAGGAQQTIYQTLSPAQAAIYNQGNLAKSSMTDLALQGSRAASGIIGAPGNFSGAPQVSSTDFTTNAPALRSTDFTSNA